MQHEEQVIDNSKQAPQINPDAMNANKNKKQNLPKSDVFQENKNTNDKTQEKAQLELVDKNKDQQKQQQPNINVQDFIKKQREIAQKGKMTHDKVKQRMQMFAMLFYNNQQRAA